ncbi:MAG: hypothetical protein U0228_30185 [Myxococcaceae bacterium]
MNRSLSLAAVFALALAGCDAAVKIDPDGYRCDVGNACPTGYACQQGVCHRSSIVDPSCANVSCTMPPAATCKSATVLTTFVGRCANAQCSYDPVDMTCATSCSNGACVDACAGVSCVTPPVATCVDASTLRTFAQTGSCTNGTCGYQSTDTTCPNGCMGGRCQGVDLCRQNNVMCTTPPDVTCVGNTRRTFQSPGTCDPGTGTCTYSPNDMVCPNGCANGQCLTPSLTFTQIGPRLRFAINALDIAPGSSGNLALAVGASGKVSRWDGSTWTDVMVNSTARLNSVAFVNGSTAYVAGATGTLLAVRNNNGTPINVPGASTANWVSVSGRSDQEAMVVSESGQVARQRNGNWSSGPIDAGTGPFAIAGAYMDESLRERAVGTCNGTACVAYRNLPGGTPGWTVQTRGGTKFAAIGGGFDIPATATTSVAFLGSGTDLVTHDTAGFTTTNFFNLVNTTPTLDGDSIVGVTAQAVTVARDVYVLTSSAGQSTGHLYRVTRGLTQNTANDALQTFYGEEHLSPNDSSGVLVAEVRRSFNVNNVFRRGPIVNEALDVGEDFVGASADSTGALVFIGGFGDIAIKRQNSTTFDFRRVPGSWSINGFDARNGTGVLMAGEDVDGTVWRMSGTTFTTVSTEPGEKFNAVCRVSDTEAWAVGTTGTIHKINGTTGGAVTSPTTEDLVAVDCAANVAIACGTNGTVLRLSGGTWSVVPGLGATGTVKTCKLTATGAVVGGDGFFASLGSGGWTMLAGKAGLRSLVVRGPNEIYGAFVTTNNQSDVSRFDGATWGPSLASVTGEIGGGVQVGGRVVWGGTLGAIVEGR